MSFAAAASPLNPIREALGRYKADRERCVADIDLLVDERERISALLPELRRRHDANEDRVRRLHDEVSIYAHAIEDIEDQCEEILGRRTTTVGEATVFDAPSPEAGRLCVLPIGERVRCMPGGTEESVAIAHPVVGYLAAGALEPEPSEASYAPSEDEDEERPSGRPSGRPSERSDASEGDGPGAAHENEEATLPEEEEAPPDDATLDAAPGEDDTRSDEARDVAADLAPPPVA